MKLKSQDTVLIISPSGRVLKENIDNALERLCEWDLNVEVSTFACGEYHNFSGTIEERLHDLQWALDHPSAKVIMASRGGYGAIQLLDKIDWTTFIKNPKLLVGYSDICNLHAIINGLGIPSLHALMPNSFPKHEEHQLSLTTLKQALFQEHYTFTWDSLLNDSDLSLDGEIVGGNLSILYSLQGTPYVLNYKGKILFLEDLCEYLYHTDRMLRSMALSGVFSDIKGLIVGDFTAMKDNDRPFGQSIEDMFRALSKKYNFPLIFDFPTGHSDPTVALPLGQTLKIKVQDYICTLSV